MCSTWCVASTGLEARSHEAEAKSHEAEAEAEATTREAEAETEATIFAIFWPRGRGQASRPNIPANKLFVSWYRVNDWLICFVLSLLIGYMRRD